MITPFKQIIAFTVLISLQLNVFGFHDAISKIGRVKWNYTMYEENLWTRQYENNSLEQIYKDHSEFIAIVNDIYHDSDSFYPIINITSNEVTQIVTIDSYINNPYHVPVIESVILANANVRDYWGKFSNWTSFNETVMVDNLIDDAIPSLRSAAKEFWNASNTNVFFDFLKNKSFACSHIGQHELSTYKLTEKYFIDTITAQLKAYIMLQLSYLTKAAKDFQFYHKIARDRRVSFNYKYAAFTQQTENLMWNLSQIVWSCDDFKTADTYTQLTNFIQGYVDNEINLNPYGSCAPYCSDYKSTKNYDCNEKTLCAANYYDKNKTRCHGTIRDCDYFDSTFTYCPNENDTDINRRVSFVKFASGKTLGTEHFCSDHFDAKPFSTWLFKCRYCFCYCDAPGPLSDRHFSLRDVTSNISENKVISGIRLIKMNGIIHWTAVERTLLQNAVLNTTDSNLVSNYTYKIDDVSVREGIDYYTLTYENRTLNLDTITAARDQLVTGVRFRVHSGSVHLEARFTYFDEATGKLDLTTPSIWKMNSNVKRNKILTSHLGVPTESTEQSIAMGTKDTDSIEFNPSGWIRDVAQSTVPFFDSIELEPYEMVPLHGVGIIYKYQHGYGGYIAPKLLTYDYAAAAMRIRGAVGVYGV